MKNISRRGFLGLLTIPFLAKFLPAQLRTVLVADGITDDTKAFQALLDANPVFYADNSQAALDFSGWRTQQIVF
jgi:hypothetical protein